MLFGVFLRFHIMQTYGGPLGILWGPFGPGPVTVLQPPVFPLVTLFTHKVDQVVSMNKGRPKISSIFLQNLHHGDFNFFLFVWFQKLGVIFDDVSVVFNSLPANGETLCLDLRTINSDPKKTRPVYKVTDEPADEPTNRRKEGPTFLDVSHDYIRECVRPSVGRSHCDYFRLGFSVKSDLTGPFLW